MKKKFIANNIVLFATLSYGYYFFFYMLQNYSNKIGFPLNPSYYKLAEALILVFIATLFYIKYDMNDSIYVSYSYILYLFIFMPSAVYYWMANMSRAYFYMQFTSFTIVNTFFILYNRYNPLQCTYISKLNLSIIKDKIKSNDKYLRKVFVVIIIIFLICDLVIYYFYGHDLSYLFKLDKVYDIRLEARAKVPTKLNYIISWSSVVFVPTALALCFKYKKYYLSIIPIIIQLLLFTIGGNKIYIFALMLTVMMYLLFRFRLMYSLVTIINFGLMGSLIWKNVFLMALAIRRTFIFPASISFNYYEFFNIHPKMYLANSILSRFIGNQYKLDAPFIISRYVYREPEMSANVNFIANAYSNFGFAGIIIFTFILCFVLIFIDKISKNNKNKAIIVLITFSSFYALVNSGLLTAMLSHGIIVAMIVSSFFSLFYFSNKKNTA